MSNAITIFILCIGIVLILSCLCLCCCHFVRVVVFGISSFQIIGTSACVDDVAPLLSQPSTSPILGSTMEYSDPIKPASDQAHDPSAHMEDSSITIEDVARSLAGFEQHTTTAISQSPPPHACMLCSTKLDEMDGEMVRGLPLCGHLFHVDCIDMWLYSHATCPVCAAEVEDLASFPPSTPVDDTTSTTPTYRDHAASN